MGVDLQARCRVEYQVFYQGNVAKKMLRRLSPERLHGRSQGFDLAVEPHRAGICKRPDTGAQAKRSEQRFLSVQIFQEIQGSTTIAAAYGRQGFRRHPQRPVFA